MTGKCPQCGHVLSSGGCVNYHCSTKNIPQVKPTNGGPAFPCGSEKVDEIVTVPLNNGLSLRDYFAAAALNAVVAYWQDPDDILDTPAIAVDCYKISDAMLAERSRTDGTT